MSELEAGTELDAEIAVRVMGAEHRTPTPHGFMAGDGTKYITAMPRWLYPPYSTDIAAAWTVIERMQTQDWRMARLTCNQPPHTNPATKWECDFRSYQGGRLECGYASADAPTAPLAICLAALKTLAGEA